MRRDWLIVIRREVTARWAAWCAAMLLLALIIFFPLRAALGLSDMTRIGFSARQVAGTIWYGRIGEFQLRSQPFGTFEVRLDPAALLIGNVSMKFNRMDSPEGELRGRLFAGFRRGIVDTSGRIVTTAIFAPLPVEALELSDATLLFRNGQCVEAGGTVTPIIAAPVPGITFAGLKGGIECEGERARVRLTGPGGNERLEFYIQSSGRYRGWMTVRGAQQEFTGGLTTFGFRQSPEGYVLTAEGQL